MAIYKKLLNIQKAIKGLKKDSQSGKANSAFGYQYVSGTKVLSNIREHMDNEGVILKTEVVSCKNTPYNSKTKDGSDKTEVFTELELRFTWIDAEDGTTDTCTFFANGMNGMEKGLGSALTYGERYFLLKYFHIQTDSDDIDNSNRKSTEEEFSGHKAEKEEKIKDIALGEKPISRERYNKFFDELQHHRSITAADIKNKFKLAKLYDITNSQLQKLIDANYDLSKIGGC